VANFGEETLEIVANSREVVIDGVRVNVMGHIYGEEAKGFGSRIEGALV
jgi:hypothetical protein